MFGIKRLEKENKNLKNEIKIQLKNINDARSENERLRTANEMLQKIGIENIRIEKERTFYRRSTMERYSTIEKLNKEIKELKDKNSQLESTYSAIITKKENEIIDSTKKLQKSTDSYLKLWDAYNKIKK